MSEKNIKQVREKKEKKKQSLASIKRKYRVKLIEKIERNRNQGVINPNIYIYRIALTMGTDNQKIKSRQIPNKIYIKMSYSYICQTLSSIQLDINVNDHNYVVLFLIN